MGSLITSIYLVGGVTVEGEWQVVSVWVIRVWEVGGVWLECGWAVKGVVGWWKVGDVCVAGRWV